MKDKKEKIKQKSTYYKTWHVLDSNDSQKIELEYITRNDINNELDFQDSLECKI